MSYKNLDIWKRAKKSTILYIVSGTSKTETENDKFATRKYLNKKPTVQIAHLVFANPQNTNPKKLKEQFFPSHLG